MERTQGDRGLSDEEAGFTHDDPVVDAALAWFSRLRNITPDPATQAAFEAWLAQDPRHAAEFRSLESLWGSPGFGKAAEIVVPAEPADINDAFRQRQNGRARPQARQHRRAMAAAAMVLLAIGLWQWPAILLHWQADYLTATGERTAIVLPDGSAMMLNTATAVTIDFEQKRRVRLLAGEAYFDVKGHPDHPFRVIGQFGEVEVKGTAFSVRRDSSQDLVVLERGRVSVSRSADRAELHPGQTVAATRTTLTPVRSVDPANALAWREGRVIFSDQPFAEVLRELGRYYRGTVILANGSVGEGRITGNYRLDDIEEAFRTLADAAGITMHRLPGGLIIFR